METIRKFMLLSIILISAASLFAFAEPVIDTISVDFGTTAVTPAMPETPPVTPATAGTCQFALKVAEKDAVPLKTLQDNIGKIGITDEKGATKTEITIKAQENFKEVTGLFYLFDLLPGKYKFKNTIAGAKSAEYSGGKSYIEVASDCKIYKVTPKA